jgi:hypothetical protein
MNTVQRLLILLALATSAHAADEKSSRALAIEGENEESPRELYIIPWQDSQPEETQTEATRLLFDDLEPIDPEVFRRQIQYYTAPFEDQ